MQNSSHSGKPDEELKSPDTKSQSQRDQEEFHEDYAPEVYKPQLLPSSIAKELRKKKEKHRCEIWGIVTIERYFKGQCKGMGMTTVVSNRECEVHCIRSNWPIMAGLYDTNGKSGVYYEVNIIRMEGRIAIGNAIASRTHRIPPLM